MTDDAWTSGRPVAYDITGLTAGESYDVQVRAVTQAGDGPWSGTSTGTPGADTTPPSLSAAAVNGATLTLTYNEALDTGSVPASSAFTVKADGTAVALADMNAVAISGSAVTLTLASAVTDRQTVTVSYTVPTNNRIRDATGNDAAALTDQAVTNNSPDTTPPVLSAAAINGATLTLTYSEALDTSSHPGTGAFTVKVNGSTVFFTGNLPLTISGSTVTLELASAVAHGDMVTVSYTVPTGEGAQPLRDAAGHNAAAFADQAVTNNTPDTTRPVLSAAAVNGATLVLTYDEALDTNSVPASSAFTVTVADAARTVSDVSVSGRAVTLTLSSAATAATDGDGELHRAHQQPDPGRGGQRCGGAHRPGGDQRHGRQHGADAERGHGDRARRSS